MFINNLFKGSKVIKIFLLIILLISTLFSLSLDDANNLYKEGDIKTAIKLYAKLSRDGDDKATFKLGTIYYKGKDIKRDLSKAMNYFKKASAYGDDKAKYNSAIIYGLKEYKEHSYLKAYNIFLDLAQNSYAKAQNKVGQYLLYGLGIKKDYRLAVKWFEQAFFVGGYKPASCNLSLMYATGRGVFVNLGRARKLAQYGYKIKVPLCIKVFKEFNLQKYDTDKGFKLGFYRDL